MAVKARLKPGVNGGAQGLAAAQLLFEALEDQDVGIDRHTDGEDEARDARQRERDRPAL